MIIADLEKAFEGFAQQIVDSSLCRSKSEVLRAGMRPVQDRETRLSSLDDSIRRGIADADVGRTKSADEVFRRLSKKYGA